MKTIVTFVVTLFFTSYSLAQDYTINTFNQSYDTLTDYNSLSFELAFAGELPFDWAHVFEFGFSFPFYGQEYDSVLLDSDGYGLFEGSEDYNLSLFAGEWTIDNVIDTPYIFSEIRYKHFEIQSQKVFVLEYHNVYLVDEFDENGTNHFINYQAHFYEDGTIEIHFGEINLDQCSYYFPGYGFSTSNVTPQEIYGPWAMINNHDMTKSAIIWGDLDDPDIAYDDSTAFGVLTSVPASGDVIQFQPNKDSSLNVEAVQPVAMLLTSRNGLLSVNDELHEIMGLKVYDLLGREVSSSTTTQVQVPEASRNQILFVEIQFTNGTSGYQKLFVN